MFRARQFLALTIVSAAETMRQPVILLLSSITVLACGLIPLVNLFQFGEDGKLARDSAFSLHFLAGLFVAGYAASTTLANELRKDTASSILCKPVSRELFFIAKFASLLAIITLFALCATIATLLTERAAEKFTLAGYIVDIRAALVPVLAVICAYIAGGLVNWFSRRSFNAVAFLLLPVFLFAGCILLGFLDRSGRLADFSFRFDWRLVNVSILLTMALVIIAAFALTLSTRLGTAPNLSVLFMLFLVGMISDYLFNRGTYGSSLFARFIYALAPNWQHFWRVDTLTGGGVISTQYLFGASLYAAAYTAGILCVGILAFRKLELK